MMEGRRGFGTTPAVENDPTAVLVCRRAASFARTPVWWGRGWCRVGGEGGGAEAGSEVLEDIVGGGSKYPFVLSILLFSVSFCSQGRKRGS